jgi:ankyrin repeat protein
MDIIKLLLGQPDLNIDAKEAMDRNPFCWAAITGQVAVVKLLLTNSSTKGKVDFNPRDDTSQTTLYYAALAGHLDFVKLLLEKPGNQPELRTEDQYEYSTALGVAYDNGH